MPRFAARDDRGFEGRNFFTARVSRNVGRRSMIGGLFTHGNPDSDDPRPLAGVDGRYAVASLFGSKSFIAEGALFRTFQQTPVDDGQWGGAVRIDYPNDPFSVNLSFKEIGTPPALGIADGCDSRAGLEGSELPHLHSAAEHPDRVGRALRVELHPGIRVS